MSHDRLRGGGTSAAPGSVSVRCHSPGDDDAIVALLNLASPQGWGTRERWKARHLDRPGFSPEDAWLAFDGDRLVGCLHTALYPVSLGGGRKVVAALDGDLALHPEWRSRGVAEALYAESWRALQRRGAVFRFGFSEARVRVHYYTRVLGYATGFESTRCWKKHLDPAPLALNLVARLGGQGSAPDTGRGPVLQVEMNDLPPIRLRLGADGVRVATRAGGRTLRLIGRQQMLNDLQRGPGGLLAAIRRGGVRCVGSPLAVAEVGLWCLRRRLLSPRSGPREVA